MSDDQLDTIEIHQGILSRRGDAGVGGGNYIDDQGRWVAQLDIADDVGGRMIHVVEGETFEWDGGVWKVAKVYEPRAASRRRVATITKVS